MDAHEHAMQRAVDLIHQAEDVEDYRERDSLRGMASVYVSMAKELRLGKTKSRTYASIDPEKKAPPPARLDASTLPHNNEEEDDSSAI